MGSNLGGRPKRTPRALARLRGELFMTASLMTKLLVQIPGGAAKMPRAAFDRAMKSMPSFRSLMFNYVQAFLEQVLVSVACNGRHSLKERLARWLLMMRDRSDEDIMPIGQDLLAEMLGVQRPSITHAIAGLEAAGLVERGRQQITILDRQGLIEASCECYRLVRERTTTGGMELIGNITVKTGRRLSSATFTVHRRKSGALSAKRQTMVMRFAKSTALECASARSLTSLPTSSGKCSSGADR